MLWFLEQIIALWPFKIVLNTWLLAKRITWEQRASTLKNTTVLSTVLFTYYLLCCSIRRLGGSSQESPLQYRLLVFLAPGLISFSSSKYCFERVDIFVAHCSEREYGTTRISGEINVLKFAWIWKGLFECMYDRTYYRSKWRRPEQERESWQLEWWFLQRLREWYGGSYSDVEFG